MQEFSFEELDELYREVILDHYRHPRNRIELDAPDIHVEGLNPFCGDEVVLNIKLDGSGRVEQVGFRGQGCSISQASASMMTELLDGKTIHEALKLSELFQQLMHGRELSEEELEKIGTLEALQGVRKFPIRIKCALLAWATLEDGIQGYRAKTDKG